MRFLTFLYFLEVLIVYGPIHRLSIDQRARHVFQDDAAHTDQRGSFHSITVCS